jgi:hypothetical protein
VIVESKELKKLFEKKFSLVVLLASAGFTTAGGLCSFSGVTAGTQAGQYLASKSNIFSLLSDASNFKKLGAAGQAVSGIGQGSGTLERVFDEQGNKTYKQYHIDLLNKHGSRADEDARQGRDKGIKTISALEQHIASAHQAASRVLSSSAG